MVCIFYCKNSLKVWGNIYQFNKWYYQRQFLPSKPITANFLVQTWQKFLVIIPNTLWRAFHLMSLCLIPCTMAEWKCWQCHMGWWGAGSQQLNNDEIDVWQPVTGECQPICLSVSTERWMTLQPRASGNIHSAAVSWEAHHPSPSCQSPLKTSGLV